MKEERMLLLIKQILKKTQSVPVCHLGILHFFQNLTLTLSYITDANGNWFDLFGEKFTNKNVVL